MSRVKRGNVLQNRHKKIIKYAKGFRGSKSKIFIAANQAVMRAWRNSFADRRKKKRDFRRLWITRINAACREHGLSYSKFIWANDKLGVTLNRKVLAEVAVHDKDAFAALALSAKTLVDKTLAEKVVSDKKAHADREARAAKKKDADKAREKNFASAK
jgi:large subunit ribosomal protein L20